MAGAGPARRAPHLEDGHGLGEVVLLHGGRGVESCQGVVELLQVAVTEAPVVQVMTQTRDQQPFALKKKQKKNKSARRFKTKKRDVRRLRASRSPHTDTDGASILTSL